MGIQALYAKRYPVDIRARNAITILGNRGNGVAKIYESGASTMNNQTKELLAMIGCFVCALILVAGVML
jgi:hypothetical protein